MVFGALFFAGMALVSLRSFHGGDSLLDSTLAVWSEAAPLTITAAAAALVLTEVGRSIVVIARRLEEGLERVRRERREEGRKEGLAEGREEGLAEGREEGLAEGRKEGLTEGERVGRSKANKAWRSWLERRAEAEAEGRPFTDPPPEDADPEPATGEAV